jgi:hypothetical protein
MKELTPLEAIRALSGIFGNNLQEMQERLALCCLLSRYILGGADKDFVYETMEKVGIKLIEAITPNKEI